LEDDYCGKRAHRNSERKLFPETGLIGPVQNLEVQQKFTIPNDRDFLWDSSPQSFNGALNSSLMYNELGLGSWPFYF
jgi:hypothetical protein